MEAINNHHARDGGRDGGIVEIDEDDSLISDSESEDQSDDEFYDADIGGGIICSREDEDALELNEKTILQIMRNNPDVTSLKVRHLDSYTDGGVGAGHFIGSSTQLKKLVVQGEFMAWEADFPKTLMKFGELCKGLSRNRSVEKLTIRECYFTDTTALVNTNLFRICEHNNNLKSLEISRCDLEDDGTVLIAAALSKRRNKGSLERINFFLNGIGDEAAGKLIDALEAYDNLTSLSLGKNFIEMKGVVALGKLLSSQRAKLIELNLENTWIDDKMVKVLGDALSLNTTLKDLNMKRNEYISPSGWRVFADSLNNPKSALENLDVGSNDIGDEGVTAFGNALANNTSLRNLDLSFHDREIPISASGWESFFACLHNSVSGMDELHIRGNNIDDKGLMAVTNALAKNSKIKILDLGRNPQASPSTWRYFFTNCLQRIDSPLEGLFLCENNITDNLMADIAQALRGNKKLEALDLGENPNISKVGWLHFSKLMCDKSSISKISSSNHTIEYLGPERHPADLASLVDINHHRNKKEALREKILRCYFMEGLKNMQTFLDMELNVLPYAMSWIGVHGLSTGRDRAGRSLVYQILRSLPSLSNFKSTAIHGTKRRRVDAENLAHDVSKKRCGF